MGDMLQKLGQEMAGLVDGAAASVLQVDARRRLPATGIAWTERLVITANHVVEADDDITIGTAVGDRIAAELIGRDPRRDLALLQVESALPAADRADNGSLRVGELVLALGRPRQDIRAALGIVTGLVNRGESRRRRQRMRVEWEQSGLHFGPKGRRKKWQKRIAKEFGAGLALAGELIQVDLTMYPGFSGGPLVGTDGKVHGMTTSGFGGGFGLAIPIAALSSSVAALQEHGAVQSGYLGVGLQPAQLPAAVAAALRQETGLLIVSIEADSPAAAAGLLVGDILTGLDHHVIDDVDELQMLLLRLEAGATVNTAFIRGGEQGAGKITIGAK